MPERRKLQSPALAERSTSGRAMLHGDQRGLASIPRLLQMLGLLSDNTTSETLKSLMDSGSQVWEGPKSGAFAGPMMIGQLLGGELGLMPDPGETNAHFWQREYPDTLPPSAYNLDRVKGDINLPQQRRKAGS